MQRRHVLQLGLGAATLLGLAGGTADLWRAAWTNGRLAPGARDVVRAVARAVLDGSLPGPEVARDAALDAHLQRFETALAQLPAATRRELSRLLALLSWPPGRVMFTGLRTPWADAGVGELQAMLEGLRASTLTLRQQAYHALRDLTNAAYYADPATWPALGYPGPRPL